MSAFQIHRVVGGEEIPRTSDRHFLVREAAGSRGGGRAEDESGRPWKKQAVDPSEPKDLGVAAKKAAERLVVFAAAAPAANLALPATATAAATTAAVEHSAPSAPRAATSEADCLIAAAAAAATVDSDDRRTDQEGVVAGVYDSDAAENPLRCEARAQQRDTRHY